MNSFGKTKIGGTLYGQAWNMAYPHMRDYQSQAIDHLVGEWDAGAVRVPMVLATGLGKTEIFSPLEGMWVIGNEFMNRPLHETYGLGARVLVLAHTDELIEQAAKKARLRNPKLSVGVVKAGQNETTAQVIVSSRQTLASAARRAQLRNIGLIIIDECHHALRTNTYGKILEHFGAFELHMNLPKPRCLVAGFTATLARSDKGKLSTVWERGQGGGRPFTRDILFGIRRGYLLDVTGQRVIVPDMDLSGVKKQGGDYQDAALAEELERTFAPQIIAAKYAEVARDAAGELRMGLAFWPLVETAYHGAEAFEDQGIPSAVVHGGLPREERRLILKRFHAGEIKVVHNCMVLTEGFDEPRADVVVVARPTKSAPLYQQMVGRVLRPDLTIEASARGRALVLDVTGAGASNDLCSLIDLSPERRIDPALAEEERSLLELDDLMAEFELRSGTVTLDDPAYVHDGPAEVREFDPLHRTRTWQQTPAGTYYMPAGANGYVFLAESFAGDPGQWDVVWCAEATGGGQQLTGYQGLSLDEALLAAEDETSERGGLGTKTLTTRSASWRKLTPTEAQLKFCRTLGIVVPLRDGVPDLIATSTTSAWNKGQVADAITARKAARRIDPLVKFVTARMGR